MVLSFMEKCNIRMNQSTKVPYKSIENQGTDSLRIKMEMSIKDTL